MTLPRDPAPADLPSLDRLRALVLRDTDGDGFPDALIGPVWIANGAGADDVDAAVAAAAELLAALADHSLVLPIATRAWDRATPGFAIGLAAPEPAVAWTTVPGGALLGYGEDGLVLSAPDGATLVTAVNAWLDALRAEPTETAESPAQDERTTMPADVAIPSLGTAFRGAGGASLHGSGFYTGAADHPERFVAGFAAAGGVPAALAVAVRLALVGTRAPRRLTAPPDEARVRTRLDPTLDPGTWAVRTRRDHHGSVLDVTGHDATDLAAACRWFADAFPRLADGTWLEDLEDGLSRYVRGETRAGRVAAVASAARAAQDAGDPAAWGEARYLPAHARRQLGFPIRNRARAGVRRRWSTTVPWEGDRLAALAREAAAALDPAAGAVAVEAYASESAAVRARLADRLEGAFAASGHQVASLRVRHAYRPALHWLVEEVAPALSVNASVVRVRSSRQPEALGAPDRWQRELHPVAELVEASRAGIRVDLELGPERPGPRYDVTVLDAHGRVLAEDALEPPFTESPLPDGGVALATTGALRVHQSGCPMIDRANATDAEGFWRWFAQDVLPEVTRGLDPGAAPSIHELAVVARLSEPDDRLPLDHETDSVLEALHEDVYFGALEAFEHALGAERPRHRSPGRILPFFHERPAAATTAIVQVRSWASDRTGVGTRSGAWWPAAACDATVRVVAVRGRGDRIEELELEAVGPSRPAAGAGTTEPDPDASEAVRRLLWAARVDPSVFPTGVAVALRSSTKAERLGPFAASAAAEPLPARPLHPYEVALAARAAAASWPALRAATPDETWLGQPLYRLELVAPAGPATSRARCAAWKPTVLVSARQHANEPTSTQAAFAWLGRWLTHDDLARRANLVVHPLENPDGARLHAALCALAPNHMHHAARYTAFGADLEAEPRVDGQTIAESRLRRDAARRWDPVLHLNDHGYPAHGWVRSQTGFVPRGFADWSLPTGHLTILATHGEDADTDAALRDELARAVEQSLVQDEDVREHTRAQARRSLRYRAAEDTPFEHRSGLPFWSSHRPRPQLAAPVGRPAAAPRRPALDREPVLAPWVTLITEVPDETVDGADWDRCVRAHVAVNEAVVVRFLDRLASTRSDRS